MKTTPRWIETAIREADANKVQMPWTRGARRAAFIAQREEATAQLRATA